MKERRSLSFGRDLTSSEVWASYRRDVEEKLVKAIPEGRLKLFSTEELSLPN